MNIFGGPPKRDKIRVCANCRSTYYEGDKYCRFCGAKMGKPDYIYEDFACIYGPPPMRRVHKCASCGYTWETNQIIDSERFCPECGGNAPATEIGPGTYERRRPTILLDDDADSE